MAETSNKKVCSLCGSQKLIFKETLYGALICYKCHETLIKCGGIINDISGVIKSEEERWGKHLGNFKKPFTADNLPHGHKIKLKAQPG